MSATVETLILVFLLVLAGSAMLIWTKRAPKTPGVARVWQLAWGSLALGMLVAAVTFSEPATLPAPFSSRPIEVHNEGGYVGSDTCRVCHPRQHSTWHASYHRTMTQIATPDTVMTPFDDGIELSRKGKQHRLFRKGEQLWVQTELSAPGSRSIRVERPIVLTTGSHHMQGYWFTATDDSRFLLLFPFLYLREEERWIPRISAFLTLSEVDYGDSAQWNHSCMNCHATFTRLTPTRQVPSGQPNSIAGYDVFNVDTRVGEFGIGCEACHGPGEKHVQANRNPIRRYQHYFTDEGDSSIVHPGRLSHDRSSQLCGQCHSVFLIHADDASWPDWAHNGFEYRPGGNLWEDKTRTIVRKSDESSEHLQEHLRSYPEFLEDTFWSDGMVRVSGREFNGLIETPCYQRGELSCLSCHDMHQSRDDIRSAKTWANDQLGVGMHSNTACTQCHKKFSDDDTVAQHTHHPVGSSGGKCYNCHMPYTSYGLLKAIRSHQIDSPSVSSSIATGRPNACNQCHLDKTLKWTAKHLSDWHGIDSPKLSNEQQTIAASVLWLLKGDAGQRALMAWSYGWDEAVETSGSDWMAPYLGQLLEDPYAAVRFIAHRSLRRLPEYEDFEFDHVAPPLEWTLAKDRVFDAWKPQSQKETRDAVLINSDGQLQLKLLEHLLGQRDNRRVNLAE